MSVQFDGNAANYLNRTATLPDFNAAYTWCAWIKPENTAGFGSMLFIGDDDDNDYMGHIDDDWWLNIYNNGNQGSDTGSQFSSGTWYHIAMVRADNSNIRIYLNGVEDGAVLATSISGRDGLTVMQVGQWGDTALDGPTTFEVEDMRLWTSALTGGQLITESESATPVITSNLWASWPLLAHTDVTDTSGNGRNWTVQGTLTTGSSSPSYPASGAFPYFLNRRHKTGIMFGRG